MSNTPLAIVQPTQEAHENAANIAVLPIYVAQPALPPLQECILQTSSDCLAQPRSARGKVCA